MSKADNDLIFTIQTLRNEGKISEATATEVLSALVDKGSQPKRIMELWNLWSQKYYDKYEAYPLMGAKNLSIIKRIGSIIPDSKIQGLFDLYLDHTDPFFIRSKHPIGIMSVNLDRLWSEYQTGEITSNQAARRSESHGTTVNAAKEYMKRKHNL